MQEECDIDQCQAREIDEEEYYYVKNGYRRRPLFESHDIYALLVDKLRKKSVAKLLSIFNKSPKNACKSSQPSGKHVMFADSLGMDLDIVHTIQVTNSTKHAAENNATSRNCLFEFHRVTISKQSCLSSSLVDDELSQILNSKNFDLNRSHEKLLVPNFRLDSEQNYEKLIKENICLNHVEVFENCSIRGLIFTKCSSVSSNSPSPSADSFDNKRTRSRLSKRFSKIFTHSNSSCEEMNKSELASNIKLDLVYVIWSIDKWKSWKYQAAIQKTCKENSSNGCILKTHEFFIQHLHDKLEIDQTLELIVCHQINMIVFKDTNDELCYKFKCAYKF